MSKLKIGKNLDVRFTESEDFQKLYFSLTDLCANYDTEAKTLVQNWMRTYTTLEFLGVWEQEFGTDFNSIEFDAFLAESGSNTFSMTPTKWVKTTNAIGIYAKPGRGGGTYAHILIALHFANWLSAKFYLEFNKSYFGLLEDKYGRDAIDKEVKRTFARLNYPLHTKAVQLFIPSKADIQVQRRTYADEADLLNKIVFGQSAKEWRDKNPEKKGNQRDHTEVEQLHVLANLENLNAFLIKHGLEPEERFEVLSNEARHQFELFSKYKKLT